MRERRLFWVEDGRPKQLTAEEEELMGEGGSERLQSYYERTEREEPLELEWGEVSLVQGRGEAVQRAAEAPEREEGEVAG